MGRLGQDLRYAARTAFRTPSVAILAVLAFALGTSRYERTSMPWLCPNSFASHGG